MELLINIGNTNSQLAAYDGSGIEFLETRRTSDLHSFGFSNFAQIAFASVVPQVSESLKQDHWFEVSADTVPWLDYSVTSRQTLGADRLANVVALACCADLPALCIDCGTAVTFEGLSADLRLLPGAICPGRTLQRNALHDYTSKLPFVTLVDEPPTGVGDTTEKAIQLGVDRGLVGQIKELILDMSLYIGGSFKSIVFTGGDGALFEKACAIENSSYDRELTLKGIAYARERG